MNARPAARTLGFVLPGPAATQTGGYAYDRRIARFFEIRGVDCWYTAPSLVNHRRVDENPSLVKGRTGNRQAYWFIGDASPLEIDWTKEPVRAAETVAFRHVRTNAVRNVLVNSPRFRRMSKSDVWEVA